VSHTTHDTIPIKDCNNHFLLRLKIKSYTFYLTNFILFKNCIFRYVFYRIHIHSKNVCFYLIIKHIKKTNIRYYIYVYIEYSVILYLFISIIAAVCVCKYFYFTSAKSQCPTKICNQSFHFSSVTSARGIYIFSVRWSHLAAIRDTVSRKSDNLFKYVCASLSKAPSRTSVVILLSARLHTVRATCRDAHAFPPP